MIGFTTTKPMQKELIKKHFWIFNYLQNSDLEAIELHQVYAHFKSSDFLV
jgi:hypothetical protein